MTTDNKSEKYHLTQSLLVNISNCTKELVETVFKCAILQQLNTHTKRPTLQPTYLCNIYIVVYNITCSDAVKQILGKPITITFPQETLSLYQFDTRCIILLQWFILYNYVMHHLYRAKKVLFQLWIFTKSRSNSPWVSNEVFYMSYLTCIT